MLCAFTNKKLTNDHKLLSHNNLSFFGGKNYPSILLKNRTPNPIPFLKWGTPAMINQSHLILLSFGEREDTQWEIRGTVLYYRNLIPVNFFK